VLENQLARLDDRRGIQYNTVHTENCAKTQILARYGAFWMKPLSELRQPQGQQNPMTKQKTKVSPLTQPEDRRFGYLPISETIIRWGLYLTGAGTDTISPDSPYPPLDVHPELYEFRWDQGRVLPEYQVVYIHQGRGEFESKATGLVEVKAGTAIMLFPDVWHRYRPDPSTGWCEYWISFNGDLPFHWQKSGLFSPKRPLHHIGRKAQLRREYEKIVDHVCNEPQAHPLTLSARALQILSTIAEHERRTNAENHPTAGRTPTDPRDPLVNEALRLIWNHSHRKLSVADIAGNLPVTRRTLERRFFERRGRTVHDELMVCRLTRAKRLLEETHIPIKQVASTAGFTNATHLGIAVRRELGCTPGQIRKRVQKNGR